MIKDKNTPGTSDESEILKDYGLAVGKITRVNLSVNGSIETLLVSAKEAAAAAE